MMIDAILESVDNIRDENYKKWRVKFNISDKEIYLEYFDNYEDAIEMYKKIESELPLP